MLHNKDHDTKSQAPWRLHNPQRSPNQTDEHATGSRSWKDNIGKNTTNGRLNSCLGSPLAQHILARIDSFSLALIRDVYGVLVTITLQRPIAPMRRIPSFRVPRPTMGQIVCQEPINGAGRCGLSLDLRRFSSETVARSRTRGCTEHRSGKHNAVPFFTYTRRALACDSRRLSVSTSHMRYVGVLRQSQPRPGPAESDWPGQLFRIKTTLD